MVLYELRNPFAPPAIRDADALAHAMRMRHVRAIKTNPAPSFNTAALRR
jgi:hypothetical protein